MKLTRMTIWAALLALFVGGTTYFTPSTALEEKKAVSKAKDNHDHDHDHTEDEEDDDHDHGDDHGHGDDEDGHDHEEDGHDHGDDEHAHGEHEEENDAIGPDKGITAKGENGFTLSKEAWTTFDLKTQDADKAATIPKSAIVHVKDGKYYYRVRDGWIKRMPLATKPAKGDQIITSGTGFMRTVELVVEEGVSHGHAH